MAIKRTPGRPLIDLQAKITETCSHTIPLPIEASIPLKHYKKSTNDIWNMLNYFEHTSDRSNVNEAVLKRHLSRLHRMVLLSLCASFERFLKELAAICVDEVGPLILDDRLDEALEVKGKALFSHFANSTLGKAMCESNDWADCTKINERFRKLLADPFDGGKFYVFPTSKGQGPEEWRYSAMSVVWQLRHTLAHNDGNLTESDALKLRRLTRSKIQGTVVLYPSKRDISYIKRFLDETAGKITDRVGARLSELLTNLHGSDSTILDPALVAQRMARELGIQITVSGKTASP